MYPFILIKLRILWFYPGVFNQEYFTVFAGLWRQKNDQKVPKKCQVYKIQEKNDKLKELNVTVYGSINLRTDGKRCIIAQKLEKGGGNKVWDIYKLEKNNIGRFKYVP
jgi:hypothetical protein